MLRTYSATLFRRRSECRAGHTKPISWLTRFTSRGGISTCSSAGGSSVLPFPDHRGPVGVPPCRAISAKRNDLPRVAGLLVRWCLGQKPSEDSRPVLNSPLGPGWAHCSDLLPGHYANAQLACEALVAEHRGQHVPGCARFCSNDKPPNLGVTKLYLGPLAADVSWGGNHSKQIQIQQKAHNYWAFAFWSCQCQCPLWTSISTDLSSPLPSSHLWQNRTISRISTLMVNPLWCWTVAHPSRLSIAFFIHFLNSHE